MEGHVAYYLATPISSTPHYYISHFSRSPVPRVLSTNFPASLPSTSPSAFLCAGSCEMRDNCPPALLIHRWSGKRMEGREYGCWAKDREGKGRKGNVGEYRHSSHFHPHTPSATYSHLLPFTLPLGGTEIDLVPIRCVCKCHMGRSPPTT